MANNIVTGEEFVVEAKPVLGSVAFRGTIRLQNTEEYAPILALLEKGLSEAGPSGTLSLDFRMLEFLNSSGINTISRFVITARKADQTQLLVLGNKDIYWQQKSLQNLAKLWPKVRIEIQ